MVELRYRVFFKKLVNGKLKKVKPKKIPGPPAKTKVSGKIQIEKPKEKIEGIEITGVTGKLVKKPQVDLSKINMTYPLIPRNPKKGERVYAYAHIKWSPEDYSLVYNVIEPPLTEEDKKLLESIKDVIVEKLDVDFARLRKEDAVEYLKKKFEETLKELAPDLPEEKRQNLLYYIQRDFIGLGKIEPLMRDPNIEDISCDGLNIPIFVYHRDPQIGSIRTNIMFTDADELDSFVNKLAQRCGKTISVAKPLVDAALPDGSRLQATLATDIARRGSNFTIRKFTEKPLTPVHLLKYGTVDIKILAYLWTLTEYGKSTLIAGGTATGKTTLLNALSLFIKPEMKIVTIEDTAELRLPHPHWVPQVARQAMVEIGGKKVGEVDMFDLLKESLRQRPDYIIVGEVRGREAFVLFQQIATGHAAFATIHADTVEKLLDRLTTPPINLPASLIENLDCVVFLVRVKHRNLYVRRVSSIFEVVGFDREKNLPKFNEVFRWDAATDTFITVNPSVVLKKIAEQHGLSPEAIKKELGVKMKILEWLLKKDVTDYKAFADIIKLYYSHHDKLLEIMGE
ncbi:MAG: type II/IV secretion system ATPase subunit [Candidatus Micrarchaeota archaeon]|nr:type II/IV secretion system ATPase subunit [Candidatus Micrarchaeota archaeon]